MKVEDINNNKHSSNELLKVIINIMKVVAVNNYNYICNEAFTACNHYIAIIMDIINLELLTVTITVEMKLLIIAYNCC